MLLGAYRYIEEEIVNQRQRHGEIVDVGLVTTSEFALDLGLDLLDTVSARCIPHSRLSACLRAEIAAPTAVRLTYRRRLATLAHLTPSSNNRLHTTALTFPTPKHPFSTMKIAATLFIATAWCTSAFGLHGATTSSAIKRVGFAAANKKAMVQPIDIHGKRLSNMVRALFAMCVMLISRMRKRRNSWATIHVLSRS